MQQESNVHNGVCVCEKEPGDAILIAGLSALAQCFVLAAMASPTPTRSSLCWAPMRRLSPLRRRSYFKLCWIWCCKTSRRRGRVRRGRSRAWKISQGQGGTTPGRCRNTQCSPPLHNSVELIRLAVALRVRWVVNLFGQSHSASLGAAAWGRYSIVVLSSGSFAPDPAPRACLPAA